MPLPDDQTVPAALSRDFHGGKMLAAALLRTTALLGPSMILGYARAYAQAVCSQAPGGTVDSGTSFTCDIPAGTQTRPQVFYTGYGMWYSGKVDDSRPGLPITIINNADITVTGDFVTGRDNSQASNYAPALPTSTKAGPRGEITSISGGLLAFNVGSDNLDSGNDVAGGAGAAVTVTSNGSITAPGFGIAAYSAGGHGSKAGTESGTAGDGGSAGAVTISVLANVSAGTGPAVFGASYGGDGGRTGKLGRGGSAGAVTLSFGSSVTSVTSQDTGALFDSVLAAPIISGSAAAAISYGGVAYRDDGGNAGNIQITALNAEGTSFSSGGPNSPAIFARSYGGIGNASGYTGGTAGTSTVTLSGEGSVTTTGPNAPGIVAQSMGGAGQSKDVTSSKQTAATGGVAGYAAVSNSFGINTTGQQSHGIVAQSAGAGGGIFNYTGDGNLTWGDQNVSSGKGAMVEVTNSGAITTAGPDANGIVAQSIGGGGGHVGVDANAGTTTVGGAAGSVSGNTVTVANSGDITTLGQSQSSGGSTSYGGGIAIVAQSIGGGGGTMAGGHGQIGGKGTGSTGGAVEVTNTAALSTAGTDAHGILAQSIGGGGGQGRNSTGLFVATGGTGGSGGNAGASTVFNSGAITVSGDYANGIMVQSIGGGGGTGGRARAIGIWGIAVADAHGGSGGAGGTGNAASAYNDLNGTTGSIVTQGLNGTGMIAQSIGGGGGSGGAAKSLAGGVVSVSLAFGGSGGGGGAGGAASAAASGNISTYGYDSIGVLSQSIGGGGGQGGTASAKSFSVGVPVGPDGPNLSAAVSVAHGGSGGTASAGGAATASNSNSTSRVIGQSIQTSANQTDAATGAVSLVTAQAGATYSGITTFGDNSTGMLVQSIGGGGGSGGDATANSSAGVLAKQVAKLQSDGEASDIENINVAVDVALGGTGGGGGAGGSATATNAGTITTFGLFADGMVAQSIGGGGGQGGSGNAKTSATGDISVGLNVAIGASGGAGGAGGAASGGNDAGGIIVTGGNNSRGILVQSIGAGGGNAGGGGGSTSSTFGLSIGLGSSGATGGAGGPATAWNYGAITTRGDWADGITAQSIGGGGGNGGAGDSSLSITSSAKFNDSYSASGESTDTDASTNGSQSKPTTNTFAMSLGTTGGGGGDAGAVVIGANKAASGISATSAWAPKVAASTIQTSGNSSHGLLAQSIGGGGGNAAISPASSSATATLNIGAKGAGGGAGGTIFAYASNIATTGFSSHGVLAQSIGGGGGTGVAGGVATTINTKLGSENVALETGAGAGTSNNGGGVYITTQANSRVSTGGAVTVAGVTSNATDSFGILAQSIGGGGGSAAAAMGSTTASSGQGATASHTITLGGKPTVSNVGNNGGRVAVYHQGAIVTSGARGFGIAAQSIGGGGGLVSGDTNTLAGVTFTAGSNGNGGEVEVGLSNGASITTSGAGSFGILAQSIGGGGGFAADSTVGFTQSLGASSANGGSGYGAGGNVFVTLKTGTSINTTGANAHGIFAQSVTGGGGVWDNGNGGMTAGTSRSTAGGGSGFSTVGVNVEGQVAVSGAGAWGVYAQNAGVNTNGTPVEVTVSGTVSAGGQAAGAINMSTYSGSVGKVSISFDGKVTGNLLYTSGTDNAPTAMAAFAVSDSVAPSSAGSLLNDGTLTTADYVTGFDVTNTGTIDLGGTGTLGRTTFSGNLAGKGKIAVDVDLAAGQADHLIVEGNTSGRQTLSLNARSLIKGGTAEFLRTLGEDQVSLAVEEGSLFNYELGTESGKHTVRVTDADFTGAASDFGTNARAAAATLQDAWDISDSLPTRRAGISMGEVFAQFNAVEKSELEDRLLALQSFSSTLGGSRAVLNAISAANEVMSCPAFEGDGVILSEGRCMWLRGTAGRGERDNTTDLPGYVVNSTGISLGGQTEIAPDWFLGGNISTVAYDTDFSNGTESVSGTSLNMALSLKRQVGPWLFSGAIGGGVDDANSTRRIEIGDLSATAYGTPDSNLIFARARVAYEVPYEKFYLRPTLDLDLVNFRSDGYSETGAGDLNLTVDSGTETFFAATPALEVGGRVDYDNGNVMRIYGVAGVSFVNQDSYTVSASLAGAPDAERLDVNSSVEDTVGRIGLNMELMTLGGFGFRAGYDLSAGDSVTNQTGQIRVSYRF